MSGQSSVSSSVVVYTQRGKFVVETYDKEILVKLNNKEIFWSGEEDNRSPELQE